MKSILVIGMGRFGKLLASEFINLGDEVMIVDVNEKKINELAHMFSDAQIADCRNESVLRSFGIENFDMCFVTIADDFQSSLEITSLLKELGAKTVVSLAKSDPQKKFLEKIGADEVIYLERDFAESLAVRYSNDNIFDVIELTDEYSIYEIPILDSWVGKSIKELDVRAKFNLNILAVKQGGKLNPSPKAGYVFKNTDHVVVLGKEDEIFSLTSKIGSNKKKRK
ncbi:MAG: TrkA family potassium uptake protein [Ruminococcaceae bacterium]|nr:TrkA family potassium uptake protein [Oscillospiraceae bacterium]